MRRSDEDQREYRDYVREVAELLGCDEGMAEYEAAIECAMHSSPRVDCYSCMVMGLGVLHAMVQARNS